MTDSRRYDDRIGWHRDPTGRYEYRWFNGLTWTGDVAVGGQQYVDPLGVGPTPATARPRRGLAIASMIIGLASLVLALLPLAFVGGALGAVVAIVTGSMGIARARRLRRISGDSADAPSTGRAFAVAGLVLGLVALPACGLGFYFSSYLLDRIEEATDLGDYRTTVDTCDVGEYTITMTGTLTNLDDTDHMYDIVVTFTSFDATALGSTDGASSGTSTATGEIDLGRVTVSNLRVAAGQSAPFSAASFELVGETDPTTVQCRVESVEASNPFAVS